MSSRDWNRRVWRLAGPIMLSNVSVPLLGAVDTAVVGHLPGPQYIGAVAVGSVVFNFIYWGFGFLRMGTTGLTAQALGAEDPDEVRAMFLRAMGIAVILGALILLFQAPFAWAAFGLMGASPEVDTLAREYFAIRIWAAPAALANFALLGWFIGVHKAGAALALQVLANGVNIVLDLWFVMGPGTGGERRGHRLGDRATFLGRPGPVAGGAHRGGPWAAAGGWTGRSIGCGCGA